MYIHTSDSTYYLSEKFGKGNGIVHKRIFNCSGEEILFGRCALINHDECSHNFDVGVHCEPGMLIRVVQL